MTPDSPADRSETVPVERVARRARLLGSAAAVGVVGGTVAVGLLTLSWDDPVEATEKAFALGALFFGFGTLGWSGSVMAGRGIEEMQRHLDVAPNWTETDSRRAMARVAGVGAGAMVGSSLASLLVV